MFEDVETLVGAVPHLGDECHIAWWLWKRLQSRYGWDMVMDTDTIPKEHPERQPHMVLILYYPIGMQIPIYRWDESYLDIVGRGCRSR